MQTITYTSDTGTEIQVHFDDLKYRLIDITDHTATYECRGYDANGTEYNGIASFTCDELEGIEDIEVLSYD